MTPVPIKSLALELAASDTDELEVAAWVEEYGTGSGSDRVRRRYKYL